MVKRLLERRRIDAAHQLADVLVMARQGRPGFQATGFDNGLLQCLGELQGKQLCVF